MWDKDSMYLLHQMEIVIDLNLFNDTYMEQTVKAEYVSYYQCACC